MDQIDGGTLIVNKGNEERPKDTLPIDSEERQLNAVEGLAEGWKLAEVRKTLFFFLSLNYKFSKCFFLKGKSWRISQEFFQITT